MVTVSRFAAARTLAQSHSHLTKALVAAMWTYGGRGIGLLWTLILIAKLGIGGYGQYAMAFALAAIAAAPVDNPFSVRAIRESESRFLSERSGRVLVGLTAMAAGVALIPVNYLAWFALLVGGGEIVFNAYKSRAFRDGDPHRVMRMDTIRQTTSIALGTGYLMLAPQPSLVGASLLYAAPYLVIACASIRMVWGVAPKAPGTPRIIAVLFTEHLANAVYIQGDILLLGFLTNSDVAGYYSVASTFAWAVAQIGQSFGVTYHEKLRAAGGHASAGPPKKHVLVVATGASLVLLTVGVVLLFIPVATQLAVSMIVMSAFVFLRVFNFVYTTLLYLQRRDAARTISAGAVAPVKLGLVAVLAMAGLGAVSGAIASVVADALLLVVLSRASRSGPLESGDTPEMLESGDIPETPAPERGGRHRREELENERGVLWSG